MPAITQLGRVMVPVSDQDKAIEFYTESLGCTVTADMGFGEGERWVEVTPRGGGAAIALTPARGGNWQTGRMTGISLSTTDVRADHAELKNKGVDVDAEMVGGEGGVPLMFFLRDRDQNHLLIVEG